VECVVKGRREKAALKKVTYSSKMLNDFEFSALSKLEHPNIIRILEWKEVEEISEGELAFEVLLEYAA
jgi:hypothetical protein